MVVNALFEVFNMTIVGMLLRLPDPPDWLIGSGAQIAGIIQGQLDGVEKWGFIIPFETIGVVFPIALASWGMSILIRILRIVASYVTLGGGM